jgi:hypothetical protein
MCTQLVMRCNPVVNIEEYLPRLGKRERFIVVNYFSRLSEMVQLTAKIQGHGFHKHYYNNITIFLKAGAGNTKGEVSLYH